ncbi:hypothetical protein TNIN_44511 [Trichonephila inaurata madagascariensis]|uniref:Uncharacterized protein n=1 Tax=Trichonephila inaurata madagascariensis TaxID=2747483 RepID=A0A8X6WNE4_9ARAC|nr:hypothetical protein TNIN_44511 [Trichonephila inaurata madagascariensis]
MRKPKQYKKGGRLKKERWLVEEQMRHVQQEHKMSIKAEEQKCLQEVPAQDAMCEEKGETSVDVIRGKDRHLVIEYDACASVGGACKIRLADGDEQRDRKEEGQDGGMSG